ncbi:acyl-CoA carboxylase subunit epsilon [Streptacidiphilus pinicola]|uniref:Acyl-CoA carboxylase subunit epsilon n=1 Tax=Streptacidiphilus pinicola TaxID=2219663 RepID=A0A2X0I9K0_9ACTN|nr:acyl-CoA carboxylase subunit epsilon [Streptacidiphilus pinicola]RAG81632.1 acyl-CoA carboxylase subunit epsilon [Streptacidiphilus pinicola]
MSADPDRPSLRVLRGVPTAEELAVLTAVLTAVLPAARPTGTPQPAPAPTPVRVRWDRSDVDYRSPLAWVA